MPQIQLEKNSIGVVWLLIAVMGLLPAHLLYAQPPSKIDVQYDHTTQILSVEIFHVTKDPREHLIRKIEIHKNDEEPTVFRAAAQTSPVSLKKAIPFPASPGDHIRIKAFCNESGPTEETYIIPEQSTEPVATP